jgi:uncharacterized protein (DUF342 family)
MAALLDCTVPNEGLDSLLTCIEVELISLHVANPPTREQLEQWMRHAAEKGSSLVNEVLLEGKRPIPPQDGTIEWTQDFFSSGFAVDEKTGAVDYRRRVEHLTVETGHLLARVTPPKDGEDGCDVFGRPIPAGNPKPERLCAGPNVRVDEKEDGLYFYATSKGRLRWASNILAVDEVFHILGSVGLATGHVSHPGSVLIGGDVLAGSSVEAGGDVEVNGTVESADIQAGGNLHVHGGITGLGSQSIKVKGSVNAKFILEASIEANENIIVEREVVQSTLRTRGSLMMPRGRLVGGAVTALGGIVLREAGSDGLVPTLLIAAEDYALEDKLFQVKSQIGKLTRNLEKIHKKVDPLTSRATALNPKLRAAVEKLLAAAHEMEGEIERLRSELAEIGKDSRDRTKPRIYIRGKLFPETTLRIKTWSLEVKEEHSGSLRAGLMGSRIVLLPDESS